MIKYNSSDSMCGKLDFSNKLRLFQCNNICCVGNGQPVIVWESRLKIAIGSAKGIAYLHEDCELDS